MKFRLIAVLLFSLSLVSCGESSIQPTSGGVFPIVTGLRVTDSTGPAQRMVWGNPLYPNLDGIAASIPVLPPVDNSYSLHNPYPNPARAGRAFRMVIGIPEQSGVKVWVTTAKLQGDNENLSLFATGNVIEPKSRIIHTLLEGTYSPGTYELEWDGRADNGAAVTPGLYRIYSQVGERLDWRDVWLYGSPNELPKSLRDFVNKH